jgi:hypothetical protein
MGVVEAVAGINDGTDGVRAGHAVHDHAGGVTGVQN